MKMLIFSSAFLFAFSLGAQQIKSFGASDGEILYYTSIGKGPRIILLYGGPGYDVSFMKPWADTLSNNYECILFDQRGTGLSSNAKLDSSTINVMRAADDLEDLRKHLGEPQLTICGISWGGGLSQIYTAFYPKRVKKIVLISTLGPDLSLVEAFTDNIKMRRYPNEADSLKYWHSQPDSKAVGIKRSTFFFLPYFYDHKVGQNILPQFFLLGERRSKMADLMGADLKKSYDLKSKLKSYRGECIIIKPRQDVMPEEVSFQIKSILPQTKILTIEKCGHFPDLEKPNEFYKLLRSLL